MKQLQRSAISGLVLLFVIAAAADEAPTAEIHVTMTIDRGQDREQCFGSLFEGTTNDNAFVVGAGLPNAYNTRYRADRHAVQLFTNCSSTPTAISASTTSIAETLRTACTRMMTTDSAGSTPVPGHRRRARSISSSRLRPRILPLTARRRRWSSFKTTCLTG